MLRTKRFSRHRARVLPALAVFLMGGMLAETVWADIKLITLPIRERVEIQLDHGQVTLVEEERIIPLAEGVNDVVFAWTNTNVDPSSIQFRAMTGVGGGPETAGEIKILSVEYPPGQPALVWQVAAPRAGSARVRISYAIGRLSKTFQYRAVAGRDEKTLTLWQYIDLHNQSNESFGEAGMWAGFGERLERPILTNETRRLLVRRFDEVPVEKSYTADLSRHGYLDEAKRQLRVPMHYVLRNDAAHGLGDYPLLFGKARIFQDDGRGAVAFLGEDWLPFTPRDDEARLFLGVAQDIVITRTIERREQERIAGQLYQYDVIVKYEIENFKDQPVTLDLIEDMHNLRAEIRGHVNRAVEWEFGDRGTIKPDMQAAERSTADRPLFKLELPARGDDQKATKVVHTLHVIIRNEW